MAVIDRQVADVQVERSSRAGKRERVADNLRFDLLVALLAAWFMGGLFLDGWAHNNGRVDDTFFTPWHLVLYSGYAAVGALLVGAHARNVLRGYRWSRALPRGYMLSLLGVIIFGFGGAFDFVWHSLFGFEVNLQPLLSPAHLMLASGAFLFVSGPLRAALHRSETGWRNLLPALLSLLYAFSLLTFFMQYSHFNFAPFFLSNTPPGSTFLTDVYGVMSIFVPTALIMGTMLFAIRQWRLPLGAFTLILSVNSTLMFLMRSDATSDYPLLLLVGPLAGLLADVLFRALNPSAENRLALRIFAFVVPFTMFLLYLFLLNLHAGPDGLWWQIHMWLGVPFQAGVIGLFLSFLVFPFRTADPA